MPTAWQSNGAAVGENRYQHGAPVRSIGDIMTDPFRWVMASTPRKLATGALFGAAILTFIF